MNMNTGKLNRSLTLFPVIVFGLAYMAPATVFSTYGIVAQISHGMVPASYIIALIGMLFTAFSYGKMVNVYPISGSAYTYTQKTFNSHIGFLVGWGILLDYLFLPMINALLFGVFMESYIPQIPYKAWLILFLIGITILNLIGLKVTTKANLILITCQFILIALFLILAVRSIFHDIGTGTLLSSSPFFNTETPFNGVLAGASILCLSFLGFDSVSTLSEETINPKKVIPKAIFLIALIGGLIFIIVSYICQMVYPNFASFKNPDSAALEIALVIGGKLFQSIFLAGLISGVLASGLSSHASVARLLFAMGRDGVLPKKVFGYIHPKWQTPIFNISIVSIFGLSALFIDLATASSFINFGALLAFTFVNLCVIVHFFIKGKNRGLKGIVNYLLMPMIGAGFTFWLWTSLDSKALIIGAIWLGIGFIILLSITKFFTVKPPELALAEHEEAV